jgi:ribosome-associated protein
MTPPDQPYVDKPSKTRRKAQAHALQDLGADLARLSDDRLARIAMDDELRDALRELRRTRSHEGRRRQTQLVGKLMRRIDDPQPLREALAAVELGGAHDALALHRAEYWRDALAADDANVERFTAEHDGIDVQQLQLLVKRARAEKAVQPTTPDGSTRHGKAWRELFRFIRTSIQTAAASTATP